MTGALMILQYTAEQPHCPCWTGPVTLHDGHCCMRFTNPCHKEEGLAAYREAGSPPVRIDGIPSREAQS